MISLYLLGIPLERILGRGRFLTIYLLSLLGSSVSVMLFSAPVQPDHRGVRRDLRPDGRAPGHLQAVEVRPAPPVGRAGAQRVHHLQFPGISWQGHLGGFVVGAIVGAAMVFAPRQSRAAWQWGVSIGLVVVLAALTAIAADQIGSWYCLYQVTAPLSCVPAH